MLWTCFTLSSSVLLEFFLSLEAAVALVVKIGRAFSRVSFDKRCLGLGENKERLWGYNKGLVLLVEVARFGSGLAKKVVKVAMEGGEKERGSRGWFMWR